MDYLLSQISTCRVHQEESREGVPKGSGEHQRRELKGWGEQGGKRSTKEDNQKRSAEHQRVGDPRSVGEHLSVEEY